MRLNSAHNFLHSAMIWRKACLYGAAALCMAATGAAAQDFPSKPVRVIVSTAPGDPGDIIVRLIQNRMTERLGQQWIAEPRAGASGRIATAAVAKAPPDGHTLLVVLSAHAINPAGQTPLPYDTGKDLAGVSMLARQPLIVTVHPSVKGATLKEFVAAARANPAQKLSFSSPGAGTLGFLIGEDISRRAGLDMAHAPFKGGSPAVKAAISNEVQMTALIGAILLPSIRNGALKAIAVTSDKRMPELPDVPTMIESGFGTEAIYNWIGIFAPGATPRPIINRLNAEMNDALNEPAVAKWMSDLGFEKVASRPEELDAFVAAETARWIKFTREFGIAFE